MSPRQDKVQAALQHAAAVAANQQACAWIHTIPDAPVYHPSLEEFQDPIGYIQKIQGEAAQFGICRIVPPCLPATSAAKVLAAAVGGGGKFSFTARSQQLGSVQWTSFNSGRFLQFAKVFTVDEFERHANTFARKQFGTTAVMPPRMVEAEYWRLQSMQLTVPSAAAAAAAGSTKVAAARIGGEASAAAAAAAAAKNSGGLWVNYGNDVEGSAFSDHPSDPLGCSNWNLQVLPRQHGSLLSHLAATDLPGISSPMLYIGSLFSSFAWHTEDHYLYSINYHHLGAPKTWCGVPASDADGFERVVLEEVYGAAAAAAQAQGASAAAVTDWGLDALLAKTTIMSPELLMKAGVQVFRAVQQPGEFVVTFPRAYHGGFSNGFNIGEAVNFATGDWLPYGEQCSQRYARLARPQMLLQEALLLAETDRLVSSPATNPNLQLQQLQQQLSAAAPHHPTPLRTTLRSFIRLVRRQHAWRLALIQKLAAAGVDCCCQEIPQGMASTYLTCKVCQDCPAVAVVVPPVGADGVQQLLRGTLAASKLAAAAGGGGSGSSAAAAAVGRSCGGGCGSSSSSSGQKWPYASSSSCGDGSLIDQQTAAAAAARGRAGELSEKRQQLNTMLHVTLQQQQQQQPQQPQLAAAAAEAAAAAAAVAGGPLCLTCGLAAASCAADVASWQGCMVMLTGNILELEALARRLEGRVCGPISAESCLGDAGLTEPPCYNLSSSSSSSSSSSDNCIAAAVAGGSSSAPPWAAAADDLSQPFAWQPDAPGMECLHASQIAARKRRNTAAAAGSVAGTLGCYSQPDLQESIPQRQQQEQQRVEGKSQQQLGSSTEPGVGTADQSRQQQQQQQQQQPLQKQQQGGSKAEAVSAVLAAAAAAARAPLASTPPNIKADRTTAAAATAATAGALAGTEAVGDTPDEALMPHQPAAAATDDDSHKLLAGSQQQQQGSSKQKLCQWAGTTHTAEPAMAGTGRDEHCTTIVPCAGAAGMPEGHATAAAAAAAAAVDSTAAVTPPEATLTAAAAATRPPPDPVRAKSGIQVTAAAVAAAMADRLIASPSRSSPVSVGTTCTAEVDAGGALSSSPGAAVGAARAADAADAAAARRRAKRLNLLGQLQQAVMNRSSAKQHKQQQLAVHSQAPLPDMSEAAAHREIQQLLLGLLGAQQQQQQQRCWVGQMLSHGFPQGVTAALQQQQYASSAAAAAVETAAQAAAVVAEGITHEEEAELHSIMNTLTAGAAVPAMQVQHWQQQQQQQLAPGLLMQQQPLANGVRPWQQQQQLRVHELRNAVDHYHHYVQGSSLSSSAAQGGAVQGSSFEAFASTLDHMWPGMKPAAALHNRVDSTVPTRIQAQQQQQQQQVMMMRHHQHASSCAPLGQAVSAGQIAAGLYSDDSDRMGRPATAPAAAAARVTQCNTLCVLGQHATEMCRGACLVPQQVQASISSVVSAGACQQHSVKAVQAVLAAAAHGGMSAEAAVAAARHMILEQHWRGQRAPQ